VFKQACLPKCLATNYLPAFNKSTKETKQQRNETWKSCKAVSTETLSTFGEGPVQVPKQGLTGGVVEGFTGDRE